MNRRELENKLELAIINIDSLAIKYNLLEQRLACSEEGHKWEYKEVNTSKHGHSYDVYLKHQGKIIYKKHCLECGKYIPLTKAEYLEGKKEALIKSMAKQAEQLQALKEEQHATKS